MGTFGGAAAETDCCGNLYPLHVPLDSRERWTRDASLAATTMALAARVVWTVALVCAWSAPSIVLGAGLL
jgi:hypothetical protein